MSLNVLIVSQHFWPESFRINDLSEMLADSCGQVKNVSVLTGKPNYPEGNFFSGYRMWGVQYEKLGKVEVTRVPVVRRGDGSAIRLILNYLSFLFFASLIAPFLFRKKKVDIIFVYGTSPILQAFPAVILKWMKRAKLIIWVQDLWPESLQATGFVTQPLIIKAVGRVVRWLYKQTDLLLVQSKAFIEPVAKLSSPEKVRYYPNPAENVFAVAGGECPIPEIKNKFSVVFAGNLGTAQALDVIVDCAERLRDVRDICFVLVGHGSQYAWLEKQVSERRLENIRLAGRYPIAAMPSILGSANALLVTLKDEPIFRYTIPSKIQAYMASGRPIIGCLNGAGASLINEAKAGLTCEAENAEQLSRRVLELYEMSPEARAELGMRGQHYFQENFESNKLVRDLLEHFSSIGK